jgi:hypothetical protein
MTEQDFTTGRVVQERAESGRYKTAKKHGKNAMALPLTAVSSSFT